MRVALRIDQHDAILVEQPRIAFNHNPLILPIAETQPGATISQDISALRGGGIQGGAHALPNFPIPLPAPRGGIHAGQLPQAKLRRMGAAAITAADEGRTRGGDAAKAA